MSKLSADGSPSKVADLTNSAITYSGLILVPGLVGGLLLGDRLLLIYGPAFQKGTDILGILVLAALIWTYSKQFYTALNALDRPDLTFRANAAFILLNGVLNLVLIYLLGLLGAALATLGSSAVALVLSYYYVHREITVELPVGTVSRQWIAAIIMGFVVVSVQSTLEANLSGVRNVTLVLFLVGVGGLIYFGTLLGISRDFREIVAQNLTFLKNS